MSKVLVILVITSVGLGLLSLHLVNRLRKSDAAIAELKTEIASLQAAGPQRAVVNGTFASVPPQRVVSDIINRPPSAVPAPPKDAVKTGVFQVSPAPASSPPPRLSHEEGMRLMREHRERQQQLMKDPEYREAMRLQARNNLARQYPGLIEELGLNQSEAEAFFTMLADQQMRSSEQMEPLWEAQSPDNRELTVEQRNRRIQQVTDMQRNNEAELVTRFGQQRMDAWKDYQSTLGQRWQLEQMRSTLAAQGVPLSDDFSKPMLKAMAAAQQQEVQEYIAASQVVRGSAVAQRLTPSISFEGVNVDQMIEQAKKRNQRTLDAISSYLTPAQRQALEKDQEAQIKMQEAQMRLMRARGNNNQSGMVYAEGAAGLTVVQPLQ